MPANSLAGMASSKNLDPPFYNMPHKELLLSNDALLDLLQATLAKNGSFRFRARGFSMYPFIRDGDVLTLSKLNVKPDTGDVVAFRNLKTGRLIIHRIISEEINGYLIRGDNAQEPDGIIPPERLLGLVTRVDRKGKRVGFALGPERRLIAFISGKGQMNIIYRYIFPFCRVLGAIAKPKLRQYDK